MSYVHVWIIPKVKKETQGKARGGWEGEEKQLCQSRLSFFLWSEMRRDSWSQAPPLKREVEKGGEGERRDMGRGRFYFLIVDSKF